MKESCISPAIIAPAILMLALAVPVAAQVYESGGHTDFGYGPALDRENSAVSARAESEGGAAEGSRIVSCSTSYCLQQATLNGAGSPADSSTLSFALDASMGQEMAVGCSSSPHYVVQSGFWGYYGPTLVPVILMVTKDPGNPEWPVLEWSGNNAPYSVYRAEDGSIIFDSYYDSTGDKIYPDEAPLPASLVFYNVLATAPGRMGELFSPAANGSITVPEPAP